jgi:hypothetical protein
MGMKKGRAQEVRGYKIDEIEARPEDHMIAHDKRPGNTYGLVKGPRPGWCDGPGWPVGGGDRADPRSDVATRTLPRPGCPGMGRGAHLRVVNLSHQRFPARGSRTSRAVLYLQPELPRTP